jgi:hypothetical protein
MADDFGGEAMAMVERDGSAHRRIMQDEESYFIFQPVNLTIPVKRVITVAASERRRNIAGSA